MADKARAEGRFGEVGISAFVDDAHTQVAGRLSELVGVEHVEILVSTLETHAAVVGYMELFGLTLSRHHLYDACSTAATILRCLRGILQDGEALDVGRVDGAQRDDVRLYTVDHHQRVVAARERGGTTHAHSRQHGLVVATRLHLHTSRLTAQGVKRVGYHTFVHPLAGHRVWCVSLRRIVAIIVLGRAERRSRAVDAYLNSVALTLRC